eukprot:TRINITY_DN9921_c0_g1_i1.p1 TRINITY_DN9921_c0_g1~~TRINITY_DN9921_c0_g1_i1.p1  ORF type:complete len:386 (+),score=69.75 TRINITY_DN9921_c0_g1_i1:71-1228(+)
MTQYIGLMSGTSCDGIDAALIEIKDGCVQLKAFHCLEYTADERERLLAASAGQITLTEGARLNVWLGHKLAMAANHVVQMAKVSPLEIKAIGSHGHTVCHLPDDKPYPSTLQLGESAVIAAETGCVVVNDFRPADIAQGGQGAPLIPYADQYLHERSLSHPIIIVNIGGIANITVLTSEGQPLAFDTGPGNMLIDKAVQDHTGSQQQYDHDGRLAHSGTCHKQLLQSLLQHSYYTMPPSKSAGRETFGASYYAQVKFQAKQLQCGPIDLITTLTKLTSRTIAQGIAQACQTIATGCVEITVAGGGVHNSYLQHNLKAELERQLPQLRLIFTDYKDLPNGCDPDAREAVCFALLADATLRHIPGNVPSATGAKRPTILGKIAYPSK